MCGFHVTSSGQINTVSDVNYVACLKTASALVANSDTYFDEVHKAFLAEEGSDPRDKHLVRT